MARRAVEEAGELIGLRGRSLAKMLENLATMEARGIPPAARDVWPSLVRKVGNVAAHAGGHSSHDETSEALVACEQFLHFIFVRPLVRDAHRHSGRSHKPK